ncbi:hypothetical protein [Agrobacterium tumefaciens]|uniref:hypothetical protein n=1 Tax=Agrobacterium tumefaciens TaxID=358 RepID=UPI0021D2A5C4|nr:hypothetical protein [Agrobacterium tumefaciens]UXS26951.1 hypothetical protein FY153_21050 [Agrobacterium tumefaciens]UXS54550.1 hypothetical protein FY148_17720 [Agrobacterium tumefaciens]UXS65477.1 hypothetical protein FY147_21475 [Agrobacterium tumefaciens]
MMPHDDASHLDLEPRLISRYLTSQGWKLDHLRGALRRIWLPEDGSSNPLEVFLNFDSTGRQRDVIFALTTISQFYEKNMETLINEIRALAYDVITSRIPDEYVRNDSIELRIASEYIHRMKALLASSATTELNGERFYKRMRKEAVEYSERCRFGHTFRGSFGFSIESPVGLNDSPTLDGVEENIPFERRVVERLFRGFKSLSRASHEANPSIIVEEKDGFSSNMCDAIVDIIEDIGISKIDMEIAFSPEWRSPEPRHNSKFSIQYQHLDILKDAAKAMRTEDAPRLAQVVGRIKRLETEGNPADLLEDKSRREIEVSWVNEDNQLVHVKMGLSPESYLQAVEAHKNGHAVIASGMLSRSGRFWRLDPLLSFGVVG